jgi:hypothetical protein
MLRVDVQDMVQKLGVLAQCTAPSECIALLSCAACGPARLVVAYWGTLCRS